MVNYTQIIDYLKTKIPNFQSINKRGQVLFTCPNLSKHKFATTQPTMTIINGSDKYYCLSCGLKTTAYGLVRIVENKPNATDEEMISFLTNTLKMDNYPELEIYKKYSWQLFPLAQNSKVPLKGEHWREKEYTSDDKAKWITWIEQGLNLAVNCEFSDTMIIDVDTKEVSPESLVLKDEIIKLLEENKTLVQNTPRFGKHYVFKIDEELCFKQKVDIGGLKIDTRTNKGYFLISPSKINNVSYNWVNLGSEIKEVSQPLKEKLLSLMKLSPEKKEEPIPEIKAEHPIELVSNNLDGNCNNTFVQFGGALLKMGLDSTKIKPILFYLNKHWLKQPMPASAIDGMLNSLGNYKESEETTQEKLIYECCQLLSADISAKDVMEHTGLKRAMIDKILAKYHKEGKLTRQGRGRYCIREKVEWVNGNENTMGEIKYNVPYFNDVAYFRQGDILLIGGKTGSGKTIIAINIIKQLKEQGIKPYYVSLEAGSRYEKIAGQLGLSNQDFYIPKIQLVNPNQIEIEPNVCTVLDWLYTGEDFTATQAIFKHLNDEMIRKGGLLIVFTQLKEDYSWFAPNLVKSFPRFAARFIYDDEVGIISHFDVCKITEPRGQYQTAIIPTEFNFETKQLLKKHNI